MAAPNLLSPTTITGKTAAVSLTSTSATSILSNASASGKVMKVNTITISNVNGGSPANITINYYSAAALGGTAYAMVSTIPVPANSTLIVSDKTTAFYLEEDKSIGATAGTANYLIVTLSYEEIS